MKELIEVLNATDGDRILGYAVILIILAIISAEAITSIMIAFFSIFKRKK